MAYSVLMCR